MNCTENARRFAKLSEEILRAIWRLNPVEATLLGIHDYDHTLGDFSSEAFISSGRAFKSYVEALESQIDTSLLDDDQITEYEVALALASVNYLTLEKQRLWERNPCIYPSLAFWGCLSLLVRDYAPLEERARLLLDRMLEIPDALMVSRANMSDPPRLFVEITAETAVEGLDFFRVSIPEVASQVPALEHELLKANAAAISAVESYGRWLRESLLPRADGDFAIGSDLYEQLLFAEHYLTYTPRDILQMAKEVLDDTEAKLCEVAASIDPSTTWRELVSRLKGDHPDADALQETYRKGIRSARDFVAERDLVTIPPDESLDVRDTPGFERSVTPYAAYMPPAAFGTEKSGIFWVTPVDDDSPKEQQSEQLRGHCIHATPVIALHEAYPGHHLQLCRALDVRSPLRRQMMSSLFVEGWALYCEEMMWEQGYYTDPRIRLFQLKDVLWRACRVIIDVGLHTRDMSFDDAVRMLVDCAKLERVNAICEVKRYTMTPTQPMSYVIGKLLIMDLRDRMKRKLGGGFDLKSFHDELLSHGSIPPSLISARMLSDPVRRTSAQCLRRSA